MIHMTKIKTLFICSQCGTEFPKWTGNCTACHAWNSISEEIKQPVSAGKPEQTGYAGQTNLMMSLADIDINPADKTLKYSTGLSELDRVLGGGLMAGSAVLIGGDPGIGKSTLLLQALSYLSQQQGQQVLYVTGEESLQQVALRAKRLGLVPNHLNLLAETNIEQILSLAHKHHPTIIVIDSIQTAFTALLPSAPGSVGQVRESAAQLVRYAKQSNTAVLLIGHVTKEGVIAGPRVLEHIVDTVLYFEGAQESRFRIIRTMKNRFGAVNELGVFAMTDQGLRVVSNPSALFLSRHDQSVTGSVIMGTWEGTRPLLLEIQALVSQAYGQHPKRIAQGLDQNRLSMLLAILQRHGGIAVYDQDVFANVAGGMRIAETASDLAVLLAVASSFHHQCLPQDLMVFGETGLSGEIRPVQSGLERIREAQRQGFKTAIIPQGNLPKNIKNFKNIENINIMPVKSLKDALTCCQNL